jgi:hypothetical protein
VRADGTSSLPLPPGVAVRAAPRGGEGVLGGYCIARVRAR